MSSDRGRVILVANRGECACRIISTCKQLSIHVIAVYTQYDKSSMHVKLADEAVLIGSYLDVDNLVEVAVKHGASAIHPGWGFLSEDPQFPEKCFQNDVKFIGPTAANMMQLTDKVSARSIARKFNIDILPGSDALSSEDEAAALAGKMGYPVMLKAANGGGGVGIYKCENEQQIRNNFSVAKTQIKNAFVDDTMFLEKCIEEARHIEVQVFGDGQGNVAILGERECSVQRRNQKIIEETPAPGLTKDMRAKLWNMARILTQAVKYQSAGTAEFIMDKTTSKFYFMEMNTRLQVEHGVTEMCFGVDLVQWMIDLAFDSLPPFHMKNWNGTSKGHAIEVRVYAENPVKNFQPSPGVVTNFMITKDENTRVDTGVCEGSEISSVYDPMIAKVLKWGPTRHESIKSLIDILKKSNISGPPNNVRYIQQLLESHAFESGDLSTHMLNNFEFKPECIEIISPGLMTAVQDWPGRTKQGLWRIGVPPSGAMDHLACRLSNVLVGNIETEAVLEICITGPTLLFHCDSIFSVTGAPMDISVNGEAKSQWQAIKVQTGSVVCVNPKTSKDSSTAGCRSYLSVRGGFDIPHYLGSRSTFVNGGFGGYQGRVLQIGDTLPIGNSTNADINVDLKLDEDLIPLYSNEWKVGVLPGPFTSPDYFTDQDIAMLYSAKWKVHHDSNRLGIRLVGPAPVWARQDGGEGGSHPSNVHDYVYGIGSVNFTGNMPIIITHDGPSLGGFVCPVTIVQSEIWKVGQLKPGDTVQFIPLTIDEANEARMMQNNFIQTLKKPQPDITHLNTMRWNQDTTAVLHRQSATDEHPGYIIRLIGDSYIMLEYGDMELNLNLRFRVHFLEKEICAAMIDGILDTAPGVRSLQIHYDPDKVSLQQLLDLVRKFDSGLPDIATSDLAIESRILHLPMCFDHSGVDMAIQRYIRTVRKEAAYLPSNINFIAKNNGLGGADDVYKKVFDASYMCLGLGDVYLGAPCAVPINPLHRMVVPKYNPARTFTLEGTVGLGGAYMCIYPMSSPGGYQLVGRTLPIWNTYGIGNSQGLFKKEKPWLLKMFDQIQFYPVTEKELEGLRTDFTNGKLNVKLEKTDFRINEYNETIKSNIKEIKEYQNKQREASALMNKCEKNEITVEEDCNGINYEHNFKEVVLQDGQFGIYANMPGVVGEIRVKEESQVEKGDILLVVCAMKMEHCIRSSSSGIVHHILINPGDLVATGQLLLILQD